VATDTTNIMQVCEVITQQLRQRGFFEAGGDDAGRERMVLPAVEAAAGQLGTKLTPSEQSDKGGYTVLADGVPGLVTIVSRRRVDHPGTKGHADESVDPDFGVTWSMT
jgi:hypothetical protein